MENILNDGRLKKLYPFRSHFLLIDENQLHYVDEGEGDVIIMLHGNPTWSFYYRNLIKEMSKTHRVIVPDHMGCGLSSRPQDYTYTLENHIKNIETLLKFLNIKKFSLVVHDWGGAIGMGVATRHSRSIEKIVLLNTAAFTMKQIPMRINLCRLPFVGEVLVRHFNAFALPATWMASEKKLSKRVKFGYLVPYNNYQNRVAISRFVQDIPMRENHPSWSTLKDIEGKLKELSCPILILWGGRDFCFNDEFFVKWTQIYPNAKFKYFKNAGHYVLEDAPRETAQSVGEFFRG